MSTPPRDPRPGEETGPDDPEADILAEELAYEELAEQPDTIPGRRSG